MLPSRTIFSGFARRTPIGVDIGDDAIRVMQLDFRTHRVRAAACIPLSDGMARDQYELGLQLKRVFRKGGFTGTRCVVGVPRNLVHVHPVRAPEMPSKELADLYPPPGHPGHGRPFVDHTSSSATIRLDEMIV